MIFSAKICLYQGNVDLRAQLSLRGFAVGAAVAERARAGLDRRALLARDVAARVLVLADRADRAAALVRELARPGSSRGQAEKRLENLKKL